MYEYIFYIIYIFHSLEIHSTAHKKEKKNRKKNERKTEKERRSLKVTYKVETNSVGIHNLCAKIFK